MAVYVILDHRTESDCLIYQLVGRPVADEMRKERAYYTDEEKAKKKAAKIREEEKIPAHAAYLIEVVELLPDEDENGC